MNTKRIVDSRDGFRAEIVRLIESLVNADCIDVGDHDRCFYCGPDEIEFGLSGFLVDLAHVDPPESVRVSVSGYDRIGTVEFYFDCVFRGDDGLVFVYKADDDSFEDEGFLRDALEPGV